ncbi:MAG TPA: VTT domain-containing protein [Candidatus Eubacterium faecipullorum]|uniref:TVP38/TMEM64 family membrane protein n=1 Tax=Candidatus Eubacterium faecipullorum TaxID=2838571 RepID=A0A9D1RCG3_9FIRM|nr:VTT domain-containing protein [Candidatus Eubacterium faecipullorum]
MNGILKLKSISKRQWALAGASAAVMLAGFLALYLTLGRELLSVISDRQVFKAWLDGFSVPANAVFVFIRAFQTVIKIIPAEPLEIGSGYVWGTFGGFFYCMLGTEIGSLIILALTRLFGVRFVNLFVDTNKINEWAFIKDSKRKYLLLFIIYLIPGTPKDIITYFIGLTDTKILPFLVITGIARIPAIISSTYCGSRLIDNNYTLFIVVFALITVASALGTYFGTKYMKKIKEA